MCVLVSCNLLWRGKHISASQDYIYMYVCWWSGVKVKVIHPLSCVNGHSISCSLAQAQSYHLRHLCWTCPLESSLSTWTQLTLVPLRLPWQPDPLSTCTRTCVPTSSLPSPTLRLAVISSSLCSCAHNVACVCVVEC